MGVKNLWDIVNQAGQSRSLTHIAVVDGFEANTSDKRAFRVGIDASIWYQHAAFSKEGENPELRLLFFRLRALAELPVLPLFVFDGRERPKVKRGSKMGKAGSHALTDGMKELLDIFGMEWRMALGEAEAELAHLNRTGVIDAVMTDDVDALVFGARTVIKNPSLTLSGNKSHPARNSQGKASKHHVMVYTSDALSSHPDVALTRGGMILYALLAGGDYDDGLQGFSKHIAHGLARCGFGDELVTAWERREYYSIAGYLPQWRASINRELRHNTRGHLPHKCPSLSVPSNFPNLKILEYYVSPVTTGQRGRRGGGPLRDTTDLNLSKVARFCEDHFGDWGYRSAIIKRFRDLLWEACVMRVLRRAALEVDEQEKRKRLASGRDDRAIRGPLRPEPDAAVGTSADFVQKHLNVTVMTDEERRRAAFVNRGMRLPSIGEASTAGQFKYFGALIVQIVGTRQHVSTDNMLEYRVEVMPAQLVAMANSGIRGKRPEPSRADQTLDAADIASEGAKSKAPKSAPPAPDSVMRMWVAASIMRQVHPNLVEEYELGEESKKSGKGKTGSTAAIVTRAGAEPSASSSSQRITRAMSSKDVANTGSTTPSPILRRSRSSSTFLFSFSNPDPANADVDDDAASVRSSTASDRRLRTPVSDRFGALFDEVMGSITKTKNQRKEGLRRTQSSVDVERQLDPIDSILRSRPTLTSAKRASIRNQKESVINHDIAGVAASGSEQGTSKDGFVDALRRTRSSANLGGTHGLTSGTSALHSQPSSRADEAGPTAGQSRLVAPSNLVLAKEARNGKKRQRGSMPDEESNEAELSPHAGKRKKVDGASTSASVPTIRPFPDLPPLDDEEFDESNTVDILDVSNDSDGEEPKRLQASASSSARARRVVAADKLPARGERAYPETTSSQESDLLSQDSNAVIDLT